ncbi:MAG: FAD/NAD(P)-binding protein [Defluviicoccus sp.]|nr:FAD/NAD(P)-binding protein [Defluviicoccus sp.]
MTAVDVAIVGGGFTGAVFAIHLSRAAQRPLDIAIVEPRGRLGHGLAYDTADPDHRLNAPLAVHFIYPDAPDHLRDWYDGQRGAARDPEALAPDGGIYMRRGEFGRYVEEQLRAHADRNPSGSTIRHLRARAVTARRTSRGYRLGLDDGREVSAGLTVLAAGYDRAAAPPPFDGTISDRPGFLGDPWNTARLKEIPADARVLLLGMAQTASDVIAVLLRSGHRGPVAAVSRRGLRTRPRPRTGAGPPPDVVDRIVRPVSLFTAAHGRHASVRGLLRTLRSEAGRAEAAGGSWLEPFGDLRDSVWDVWPALPLAEKRRFLRHLRVWYDVHRFQLPPQVETRIAEAEAAGEVSFEAAACVSAAHDNGAISVTLRRRGSGELSRKTFDAVVNCTGPGMRPDRSTNPFVNALVARGFAVPHPAGVGFGVDERSRAIGAGGRADPHLRIVGPPTYGAFADQQGASFIALRLHRIMPDIAAALRL